MVHPHSAESISTLVEESMEEWGIPKEKVLTTITDNGSNMVASFHTHAEVPTTSEEDSEAEQDNANYGDEHQEDDRLVCVWNYAINSFNIYLIGLFLMNKKVIP